MTDIADVDQSPPSDFSLPVLADWRSVYGGQTNVLLEGPESALSAVLLRLKGRLREPVLWKPSSQAFDVPSGEVGGLVLQEVSAMSTEEQFRVLAWLDAAKERPRIVSTTTSPLFPCVARGLFDATLYYRLNVMLLRLG